MGRRRLHAHLRRTAVGIRSSGRPARSQESDDDRPGRHCRHVDRRRDRSRPRPGCRGPGRDGSVRSRGVPGDTGADHQHLHRRPGASPGNCRLDGHGRVCHCHRSHCGRLSPRTLLVALGVLDQRAGRHRSTGRCCALRSRVAGFARRQVRPAGNRAVPRRYHRSRLGRDRSAASRLGVRDQCRRLRGRRPVSGSVRLVGTAHRIARAGHEPVPNTTIRIARVGHRRRLLQHVRLSVHDHPILPGRHGVESTRSRLRRPSRWVPRWPPSSRNGSARLQ